MSACTPVWLDKVQAGYEADDKAKQMIAALTIAPDSLPHFTYVDGIIRYKRRVWLGDNPVLQQQVLSALHASAIGGHSSFPVTYRKMKQLFA
jgi:hypothetical protein